MKTIASKLTCTKIPSKFKIGFSWHFPNAQSTWTKTIKFGPEFGFLKVLRFFVSASNVISFSKGQNFEKILSSLKFSNSFEFRLGKESLVFWDPLQMISTSLQKHTISGIRKTHENNIQNLEQIWVLKKIIFFFICTWILIPHFLGNDFQNPPKKY